ncbi:hypothetical protein AK830_g11925 [Neonectria ditissima]|uniref:Methyltransferase domain-containing protein n=1 Tax=Neonectria ditissima TaxID=78410 RepID=A0A0P7ABS7_9HYPO|nr:hypothetical protein AK830_g11925 [Neonectria ditissima]
MPQTPGSALEDPFALNPDKTSTAPRGSGTTSTSNRSSPTKRMGERLKKLALDPNGLDFREFSAIPYPSPLSAALLDISRLARGIGTISPAMRDAIRAARDQKEGHLFEVVDDSCFARRTRHDCNGAKLRAPSCWNVEVHQATLTIALRDLRDEIPGDHVDFAFCDHPYHSLGALGALVSRTPTPLTTWVIARSSILALPGP